MWTSLVLLFGVFLGVHSSSLPLPPYVKACKADSPDFEACALEHGKLALPHILKGDRKYGLPNFYPLKINEINLETAGNLSLKLNNAEIFGLEKAVLKRVKVDLAAEQIFLHFTVANLTILGKYDINGNLLVLPIQGHGDANITATDADFQFDLKFKIIIKNGEKYLNLDKEDLTFTISRMYFYFGNLFNGDPVLGPNTNKVLNEDWQSVYKDLKPAIGKSIIAIASSIFSSLFDKVPYKFIFL